MLAHLQVPMLFHKFVTLQIEFYWFNVFYFFLWEGSINFHIYLVPPLVQIMFQVLAPPLVYIQVQVLLLSTLFVVPLTCKVFFYSGGFPFCSYLTLSLLVLFLLV